ncbi:fungal-specific transcription factor domain-containing protein [Biscogniauxia mediterranea]|nr:fungal-specific transcription factor domain-containing protein [Biscogniauxia mediterranea]
MSSHSSGKPPRVLACVLCQNRKIRCDRNSPCSNCIKANVTCTPSTPAPARKRRRPNQDLQQRLARCEELLSEYATAKPESPSNDSANSNETWRPQGKLVVDSGGVKFMDSFLLANIHDELSAMREILEDDDTTDESSTPADPQSPDQNTTILFSDPVDVNLEGLHPQPAQIFSLWQTFLERVNPLTKVIHVPTVQPMLVKAATTRAGITRNSEALMFSIYLISTVSLTESECIERLGCTKNEAYNRFSRGCRAALRRIGILKTYDLVVLQALILYLFALSGRYDRHAAWVLNGITVRIAQKMGLHRDGELLGLAPFETEMRRRIWWQIILLDALSALLSGLGQSLIPRSWNTKRPGNINDADLYPTMTSVQEKDGPTDMVYCLMSYEFAKLLTESPTLEAVILQNEMGTADSPSPFEVERASRRIDELDNTISEIFRKYGDLSMGPVHELATQTRPMIVEKLRELIRPPREQAEWGTEILTPKDNLFKISVTVGEHNLKMYQTAQERGFFLWFMMIHFQIEVLLYMVGQLRTRTSGRLVERAWTVTELFYHHHHELYDVTVKAHAALGMITVRAWRARERALHEATGSLPETPSYIVRLQSLLPSEVTKPSPVERPPDLDSTHMTTGAGTVHGPDMPWDQMLGFMDAGSLDWDMFSGNGGQPPTGYGAYGSAFGTSINSWL